MPLGAGEGLAGHRRDHLVGVGAAGLLDRLHPHVEADVGGFHRVVGQRLVLVAGDVLGLGVGAPLLDELGVGRRLDRLEVVPRRQVADQRLGVHAAQFFFTHREGHHRHVLGLQAGVAEFLVERHVGVAVDGRDHRGLAAGRELLDVGDDGLVVAVAERGVLLVDVGVLHALALQEGAQDLVGGARVHVVGAQQHPALGAAAVLAHQVLDRRNGLLVGRRAGVEHVLATALRLRTAPGRTAGCSSLRTPAAPTCGSRWSSSRRSRRPCPAPISCLAFSANSGQFEAGSTTTGFELLAEQAALGVDLVDGHQHGVLQHRFRDGHRAGQRVQHADLDGALRPGPAWPCPALMRAAASSLRPARRGIEFMGSRSW